MPTTPNLPASSNNTTPSNPQRFTPQTKYLVMESSMPPVQLHLKENGDAHKEETPKISLLAYEERISTLPKVKGDWSLGGDLCQYQGFWCYPFHLEGVMATQEHFKPQSTDIILASAPKTGTTWLKALTFAIVTRNHFDNSTSPLLSKVPHDCVPFMEGDLAENPNNRDMKIPLVATHVPFRSLPNSITASSCKIVYICRDPKDALVSLWHFVANLPQSNEGGSVSLEEIFELYCKGFTSFGPYWDHVLGYWRASLEFPDKILFLKYEELKKDTTFYVKKLANFMGYPFTLEEEAGGTVRKVLNMTSFENLSSLEVNKFGKRQSKTLEIENKVYFRKGKVGDWANHLTAEMGARLDRIVEEKLRGSGLTLVSSPISQ